MIGNFIQEMKSKHVIYYEEIFKRKEKVMNNYIMFRPNLDYANKERSIPP